MVFIMLLILLIIITTPTLSQLLSF